MVTPPSISPPRRTLFTVAVAVLALAGSACSDDDSAVGNTSVPLPTAAPSTAPTTADTTSTTSTTASSTTNLNPPPTVATEPPATVTTVELPPVTTLVPEVPKRLLTRKQRDPKSGNNSRPVRPEDLVGPRANDRDVI